MEKKEKKAVEETATETATKGGDRPTRGVTCYKSTMLNRVFDRYEDLVQAEEAYEAENAEKLKMAEEKKARAKEVEDAYKASMQARKDANKAISEADKRYYELRDAFIRDYKSFHMSYSDESGDVVVKTLFDIFNW